MWNKKKKTEGSWTYVGKKAADHAIRSSVATTKLPLGRAILKKKKNMKKEKCDFLKIFFLWIFLTFWFSYSTYSIITGPGTQQDNFKEKFCVKAGISLASERSERDTIRGVQIRACAVYIYLYHLTSLLMHAIGLKVWIK